MEHVNRALKSLWNNYRDIREEHSSFDAYQNSIVQRMNSSARAARLHMQEKQVHRETLLESIAADIAAFAIQAASRGRVNGMHHNEVKMAVQSVMRTVLYSENTTRAKTTTSPKKSFSLFDPDTWW